MAHLESAIASKERTIDELREQLQLSENKLKLREDSVRILEERIHLLQDKLKAAEKSAAGSHSIPPAAEYTSPSNANTISYLTSEVHRLRRLLVARDSKISSDAAGAALASDEQHSSSAIVKPLTPVPPSSKAVGRAPGRSSQNFRRSGARKSSDGSPAPPPQFHSTGNSAVSKARLSVGRKFSLAESDSSLEELPASIPDPTPFLSVTKAPTVSKREHLVLPPILHTDSHGTNNNASLPPIAGTNASSAVADDSYQYIRRAQQRPKLEVETLAVDQVKNQKDRKTAQECKGLNLK